MTASFSNPRWDALPCERMRGCTFADDFLTLERIAQNNGTDTGTGNTADNGLTTTGAGYISYDIVSQPSGFSVHCCFKASAVSTAGILIGNANLIAGAAATGFTLWVDATGIRANHSTAVAIPTRCSVDIAYADSACHYVTYVVDMVGGTHSLYVDSLAVDTQTTTVNSEIGTANPMRVAGDGTNNFTGILYSVRVFGQLLTETEHDVYVAGTLESFWWRPYAAYRCDSFNNDAVGHYVWDRTTNQRDIAKADRVTTAKFPTFVAATATSDAYYSFDLVDDYLGAMPTMPATYTVSTCTSTPYLQYPVVTQDNDTSTTALLVASGGWHGNLHGMVVHSKALTQLELYQDEYQHLYWQWRGRAWGQYHRLATEETCKLAMFLDADRGVYNDYSRVLANGTGFGVTRGGSAGCTFGSATSHVHVNDRAGLRIENGTIAVLGTFTGSVAAGTIVDKGANYKFLTNGNQLDFNGSTIAHTFASNQHIAVTFKSGFKPRFFVDGEYIGEGTTTETPDDTDTTDLTIGNNNELNSRTQYVIKQVYIGDEPLTDVEVKALYESAQIIGATSMETGARTKIRQVFTAVAVDEDVDPGDAFQLIDISVNFNTAPTTSEDIEITSVNSDSDAVMEYSYDPSLSTSTSHVFRFDKRFVDGTTIAIDYTNTDARTITVNTTYQTDTSIS